MGRTITLSVPPEVQELLKEHAWRNRKSASKFVTDLVKEYVRQREESKDE